MSPTDVLDTVKRHTGGRDGLISILQEVQGRYGYLPADALRRVAARTGRSQSHSKWAATLQPVSSN